MVVKKTNFTFWGTFPVKALNVSINNVTNITLIIKKMCILYDECKVFKSNPYFFICDLLPLLVVRSIFHP